jgi:hypothetical protein
MWLDDVILRIQHGLDRLVRRARIGARPERTRRRFLVIQIDGLSAAVLDRALADGRMPFLRRLLARHGYRRQPMTVGMPTSTPAFQFAAMYGARPDIPGFHYHDKRRGMDIHFPRAGHANLVETDQAGGRLGILRGGSVYGCVFTGGADNDFLSFARLSRPTGRGLIRTLSGFVVIGWVLAKGAVLTLAEIAQACLRLLRQPWGLRGHGQWLLLRVGIAVWVRELFTLAAARDLEAGVPAIYVNFLDYDVAAHAFGPRSRRAFRSLRPVDRSIRQICRVLRRVPEYQYDLYILSDHGQADCTDFQTLSGGQPLQRLLFDQVIARSPSGRPVVSTGGSPAYGHGFKSYRIARRRWLRSVFSAGEAVGEESEREAHQRDGIRVICAGPNAFLYVLDVREPLDIDQLAERLPGLAEAISRLPGVGVVLARSGVGPVAFWRGKSCRLSAADPGPFAERADRAIVLAGIADLMAMPSAGDLVIYGIDAPEGHVSYIPERGAHAGPSVDELHTFIIHSPGVTLPGPVRHPLELYDVLMRYQESPGGVTR